MEIYEDPETIVRVLAQLVCQALSMELPALVMMKSSTQPLLSDALKSRGLDLEYLRAAGKADMRDSEAVLDRVMVDGAPDPSRFKEVIGEILHPLCQGRILCAPLIYSDLADMLVRAGTIPAALQLETFWNDIGRDYSFSLMCGYTVSPLDELVPGARGSQDHFR